LSKFSFLLITFAFFAPAANYQIQANIRYDRHPETMLDILQARAPALEDRPGVIVIHGGGWVEGDKERMVKDYCLPFIEHGFVVANVEYRLADVATAPAALNDVLKAALWFRDHAGDYKVDPKRIVVTGGSAGGHLALMLGMVPDSAGFGQPIKVAAVIDFFGIADVADQVEGPNQREYAVAWIPEQPDRMALARSLSPIIYVRKGLPPILVLHGDADPVVPYEQSVRLTKALRAASNDTELITVPGGQHGFEPPEMQKVWPQVFKWLKKHKISN
jgi:acetyl esterase/lipase